MTAPSVMSIFFQKIKYADKLNNVSEHRPKLLIIPIAEKDPIGQTEKMNFDKVEYLKQEPEQGDFSRLRVPSPVLLFNGKFVYRSRYQAIFQDYNREPTFTDDVSQEGPIIYLKGNVLQENFAIQDSSYLKHLQISSIYDLSVFRENSFERDIMQADDLKQLYKNFQINSMPYPSREILENMSASDKEIEETTKNYLKILLQHLIEGKDSFLIQSFRGCDRASFFISLLRLSLWADGLIHRSLKLEEIALLTLGYDWYEFGYRMIELQDSEKEVIAFFFAFLPVISTEEFSIRSLFKDERKVDEALIMRLRRTTSHRESLKKMSELFFKNYRKSFLS